MPIGQGTSRFAAPSPTNGGMGAGSRKYGNAVQFVQQRRQGGMSMPKQPKLAGTKRPPQFGKATGGGKSGSDIRPGYGGPSKNPNDMYQGPGGQGGPEAAVDIWSTPNQMQGGVTYPSQVSTRGPISPGDYVSQLLMASDTDSGMSFGDWVGVPVDFMTGGPRGATEQLFAQMMPYYNNDPWAVAQAVEQKFSQSGSPWSMTPQTPATSAPRFSPEGIRINPDEASHYVQGFGYSPPVGTPEYQQWVQSVNNTIGQSDGVPSFSPEESAMLQSAGIDMQALAQAYYGAPPTSSYF